MKIAYLRFNLPIELNYSSASVSAKGTGRRLGILDALQQQGHTVILYTPLKKSHEKYYQNSKNNWLGENTYNQDVVSKLSYNPTGYPVDEDVLLIENGTTNTMFKYNNISFIKRSFEVIDKWSGPIFYLQWDAELGFPFGEALNTPTAGVSDDNLTKMANKCNLIKDKTWYVITTALNTEALLQKYSGKGKGKKEYGRYAYSDFVESIIPIPLCYNPQIDKCLPVKENPEHTICYVGSESDAYRNETLSKFINNQDTYLVGKWSQDKITKYLDKVQYVGVVDGHSNVYDLYNNAYVGTQCGEKGWNELGHMTSRFFNIVCGGSIPILLGEYNNKFVDLYFGKYKNLNINKKEDFDEVVKNIIHFDVGKRQKVIDFLLNHNKCWSDINWNTILKQ